MDAIRDGSRVTWVLDSWVVVGCVGRVGLMRLWVTTCFGTLYGSSWSDRFGGLQHILGHVVALTGHVGLDEF